MTQNYSKKFRGSLEHIEATFIDICNNGSSLSDLLQQMKNFTVTTPNKTSLTFFKAQKNLTPLHKQLQELFESTLQQESAAKIKETKSNIPVPVPEMAN